MEKECKKGLRRIYKLHCNGRWNVFQFTHKTEQKPKKMCHRWSPVATKLKLAYQVMDSIPMNRKEILVNDFVQPGTTINSDKNTIFHSPRQIQYISKNFGWIVLLTHYTVQISSIVIINLRNQSRFWCAQQWSLHIRRLLSQD